MNLRRFMPCARRAGFTLIEVLAALAIGALVLAGISASFYSAVSVERRAGENSREDRAARIIMDRICRETMSACRSLDTNVLSSIGSGDNDELRILSGAYGLPKMVEYRWIEGKLKRRETDPTLLRESAWISIPDISKLGLRFYDENGWQEEWNGPGIPRGIAIELSTRSGTYGTIEAL